MKLWVFLTFFMVVQADLLDLYVEHMDETMRTNLHRKKLPRFSNKRNKRSPKVSFKIGDFKKQRLDVDENWRIGKRVEKKPVKLPVLKHDDMDIPNLNEKNLNRDFEYVKNNRQLEILEGFGVGRVPRLWETQVLDPVKDGSEKELMNVRSKEVFRPTFVDPEMKRSKKVEAVVQEKEISRFRRDVKGVNFTRHEFLDDNGEVLLEWDPSDEEVVTFKVSAKTRGYIGIGFNDKGHMKGADIILAWVDDHSGVVNLLDSHGDEETNASPITDVSQDVKILEGFQNDTHTSVTFSRRWQTCDPDDRHLTEDNVRVLWAMHEADPELNTAIWHRERCGSRPLRIRAAPARPPPPKSPNVRHWDVKLNQFAVDDKENTVYWCKIFSAPFNKKHHMIGFEPLVEKGNEALVHHMILYECASTSPMLKQHARIVGTACYSPTMPREWDSCIQPIVTWARGSKGDWLPEHVGIPVAEHKEGSYYMLEVHYNNPEMRKAIDSSGIRLHLTPELRSQEAGIFVTGMSVGPLHLIPPKQKEYATAGYCDTHCTDALLPEDGVNVVSVVLHSHLAGRRMSLKHVREGKELPHIVRENHFDFDYQQSHSLQEEVKVLPGDELITECVYGTQDRTRPTLGGYAATQEMCLAFVVYYPRTDLAGCYSSTPPKDFFKTLGVYNFKGVTLDNLEKLFLTTGTDAVTLPTIVQQQLPVYPATRPSENVNEEIIKEAETALKAMKEYSETENDDNIFTRLVIENPEEFRGRTLAEHILALPWTEELLARSIERSFYQGRHMTFCRKRDDNLALPSEVRQFPNFTRITEPSSANCSKKVVISAGIVSLPNIFIIFAALCIFFC
ncbi:MOXD1 homolog 1-like [Microplitis mediator]|uniref:MOXD1 homolog 1-like n=1 Tax=Microplitis mediator TaxID=375433 RepID=UPI00255215B4|nr:MOXD1 homolog 1-like [Microplitis mediator]